MSTSDSDYSPYVVQQGDHLQKLAFRFGCDVTADAVADLAAARKRLTGLIDDTGTHRAGLVEWLDSFLA